MAQKMARRVKQCRPVRLEGEKVDRAERNGPLANYSPPSEPNVSDRNQGGRRGERQAQKVRTSELRVNVEIKDRYTLACLEREMSAIKRWAFSWCHANDAGRDIPYPDDPPKKANGKIDWKAVYGSPPSLSQLYRDARKRFPNVHSGNLSMMTHAIHGLYVKTYRFGILRYGNEIPGAKRTNPISVRADAYRVLINDQDKDAVKFDFEITFFSGRKQPRMRVTCSWDAQRMPESLRKELEAAAKDITNQRCIQIGRNRKDKWIIWLPYAIDEVPKQELFEDRVLMVRRPPDANEFLRCTWIPSRGGRPRVENLEYLSALKIDERHESLRLSFQHNYRQTYDGGRIGHGRRCALRAMERLSRKRIERQKHFNYNRARHVVSLALKWKCGVIELEDLSQIPDKKLLVLGAWAYYQFTNRVAVLCEMYGIKLNLVSPPECVAEGKLEHDNGNGNEAKGERKRRKCLTA